jgi:hypothetical protein
MPTCQGSQKAFHLQKAGLPARRIAEPEQMFPRAIRQWTKLSSLFDQGENLAPKVCVSVIVDRLEPDTPLKHILDIRVSKGDSIKNPQKQCDK